MAKVLFINPVVREEDLPRHVPYGIALLASIAMTKGHLVQVYDENAWRRGDSVIRKILQADQWDVIALGGITTAYTSIKKIIRLAREVCPKTTIVLGGGVLTSLPSEIMTWLPQVDVGVIGEGVITFPAILDCIDERNLDWAQVAGTISRGKDGQMVFAKQRDLLDNLDTLPYPAWDLFPLEEVYFKNSEALFSEEGMPERTVLVSGHSKGFAMTGWRLGWAVLPTTDEAAIFKQLNINIISCVPPFLQEGGRAAYEDPSTIKTVSEMVAAFERRRDWVVPALNSITGVTCQLPKGSFYVFPNVAGACDRLGIFEAYEALSSTAKRKTTPAGMLQMFLLYRYGVATMDRASFGRIGSEGQHFLRLSIANSMDDIQRGIARIKEAVDDSNGFTNFVKEERLWD